MEVNYESPTDENENIEKKNQDFLSELMEAGNSEHVAKAALDALGPEDVDEGTIVQTKNRNCILKVKLTRNPPKSGTKNPL